MLCAQRFIAVAHIKSVQAAILIIAIMSVGVTGFAVAQTAALTPVGLWRNIDDKTGQAKAEIRITANATGVLSGVIEKALTVPADLLCSLCTDERKGKPKLGMEIIRGAVKADGKEVWEGGRILDPDNGKLYALRLSPVEGGARLEVRGSIGPFGRTQTWLRVQ